MDALPPEPPPILRRLVENIENTIADVMKQIETIKIEIMIRRLAAEYGVDPEKAVAVAVKESSLNPQAVNVNKDGSRDRGLFQINSKHHARIRDEQAFDPEFSTRFFLEAIQRGKARWWMGARGIFYDIA